MLLAKGILNVDHETPERKPKGNRRFALVFSRSGVSAERRHFPCVGPSMRRSAEAPLRGLTKNHHAFQRPRAAGCRGSLIRVRKSAPAILWGGLLGLLSALPAGSQSASPWRVFRADDGLRETPVTSVSVSSRGNVWMTHATATEASVFDGYAVRQIPAPEGNGRILESQLGQVWSMYSEGVQEFREGRWVQHPLSEVALDYQTYPMRRIRSRQLLPTERDRVLLLLADQLMEYNAATRQTRTLKRSAETRLGLFQDLAEARDGGIWVSGARGLARVPGPPRTWGQALDWREWLLSESAPVGNLQNPIEEEGGVAAVAESTTGNERFLVWFEGPKGSPQMVPVGKVRQGWRGWDDLFWVQTINSVSRLDLAHQATLPGPEGFLASSYYDVAVQPKGVFWLATSEGLARYAPPLWRTPAALRPWALPVYALVESENGAVWIMDAQGLRRCFKEEWQTFPFPDGGEFFFQPTDSMEELSNGNLAFTASGRGYVFDPVTRVFSRPADFLRKTIRWLGPLPNRDLGVRVLDPGGADNTLRIHAFDGKRLRLFLELGTNEMVGRELNFVRIYRPDDGWVGGERGVGRWRDGRWQTPGAPEGEKPDSANVWLEVGDGKFWCGSAGKIYEFNGQGWSVVRSGFDRVNQMRKGRDGTIWVASRSGLFRYRNGSWLMHGVEEGLPAESINTVLEDGAGRLWAGASRGLSRYYPEADADPPRTFILQDNIPQEVMTGTPLTMVFGGVDRWKATPAERLLFSYRLDQGTWSSYKSVPAAFLHNLPAGSHRFEVRAMDRNGNEGAQPAVWEFTVRLPWYQETRLLVTSSVGLVLIVFLAGLAVNRHWRLRRSYAEVEGMVEQRTRELEQANQALLHSQKMQALGTLAAGIAHDFNNILSIVKGSAQIIENHLDDKEKIKTRVNRLKTVVEQGTAVVKAMLNFGKPAPKEISACDINALAREALHLLSDRFLREIRVRCDLAPDLPAAPGSQDLIQRMLVNLLLNAAEAISGAGQITVRTGLLSSLPGSLILRPDASAQWVFLAVEDEGCGIPPEVLPRIFEPFFTTKALSTRRGTGLGLSLVYEFAKDLGYGIGVESAAGKGSVFTLYLPV